MASSCSPQSQPQQRRVTTGDMNGTCPEDKLLSLARLIQQLQQAAEDSDADNRQAQLMLAGRLKQMEETLNWLTTHGGSSYAFSLKAMADRQALVEKQLTEGLTENQRVHQLNAEVRFCSDDPHTAESLHSTLTPPLEPCQLLSDLSMCTSLFCLVGAGGGQASGPSLTAGEADECAEG
jgi:hypothetical protein